MLSTRQVLSSAVPAASSRTDSRRPCHPDYRRALMAFTYAFVVSSLVVAVASAIAGM